MRRVQSLFVGFCLGVIAFLPAPIASAQTVRDQVQLAVKQNPAARMGPRMPLQPQMPAPSVTPEPPPLEKVEADVSTRSVVVTTGFTGHEILVFGAIDNSQQPEDQPGYYDVVVVVEGTPFPVVVRRKSDVAGVWVNTSSVTFASVPSYYAIASNRPIEEIAGILADSPATIRRHYAKWTQEYQDRQDRVLRLVHGTNLAQAEEQVSKC